MWLWMQQVRDRVTRCTDIVVGKLTIDYLEGESTIYTDALVVVTGVVVGLCLTYLIV